MITFLSNSDQYNIDESKSRGESEGVFLPRNSDEIKEILKRARDQNFKITNDIDQELVKSVLLDATSKTEGVLPDPKPFARLTAVDDDTYIFTIRAWCDTQNYWDVYFDLIENCSKALSENGIDDPEERIAVRIVKPEKED